MPNRDPEIAKQRKHEWYVKNREAILKRKQQRRAAKKKQQLPPSPEQIERQKELNRQACNRYRASHLEKVRAINRAYYHLNREKIVRQQRDRRALAKKKKQNPFRKLQELAQVCSDRLSRLP